MHAGFHFSLVFLHPCCQVKTEISVESKHQTLQGLAFPLQPDAQQAIQLLKQKKINYIQLVRDSWVGVGVGLGALSV